MIGRLNSTPAVFKGVFLVTGRNFAEKCAKEHEITEKLNKAHVYSILNEIDTEANESCFYTGEHLKRFADADTSTEADKKKIYNELKQEVTCPV